VGGKPRVLRQQESRRFAPNGPASASTRAPASREQQSDASVLSATPSGPPRFRPCRCESNALMKWLSAALISGVGVDGSKTRSTESRKLAGSSPRNSTFSPCPSGLERCCDQANDNSLHLTPPSHGLLCVQALPVPIFREQVFRGNGLARGARAFQQTVEVVLRTVILPAPGCADPPGALAFRNPVGNLTSA
jgi:hypothetical protein